jgi:hypothetical protein
MRHTLAWAFAREVRYHSHHNGSGYSSAGPRLTPAQQQAQEEREQLARLERHRELVEWMAVNWPPPPRSLAYRIFSAFIVGTCYLGLAAFAVLYVWIDVLSPS